MFKPILFLVFLVNVGVSLAFVDLSVSYFRAPDTQYATDALDTLKEAYDAFYPHRFLVAQSWIELFTAIYGNDVYQVTFGTNVTVVTNASVLITLEAWETPGAKQTASKVGKQNIVNLNADPTEPPPNHHHWTWTISDVPFSSKQHTV